MKKASMTLDELISEYENNMGIELSERERVIFEYAHLVGKMGWDKKED